MRMTFNGGFLMTGKHVPRKNR